MRREEASRSVLQNSAEQESCTDLAHGNLARLLTVQKFVVHDSCTICARSSKILARLSKILSRSCTIMQDWSIWEVRRGGGEDGRDGGGEEVKVSREEGRRGGGRRGGRVERRRERRGGEY